MAVSAGRATNTLPAALLVAGLTTVLLAWSCVEYLKGIHEFGVKLWTPTSRKGKEESAAAFITIMREECRIDQPPQLLFCNDRIFVGDPSFLGGFHGRQGGRLSPSLGAIDLRVDLWVSEIKSRLLPSERTAS